MGFEPGHKKMGGRSKGTPNKATQALKQALEAANFDVLHEMLLLYPGLEDFAKAQMLKDLMQYLYPKLKAIEHSGEVDGPAVVLEKPAVEDMALAIVRAREINERGS